MRDLAIAYGNSRQAKFWSNKTITFEQLCDRIKTPVRTSETTEDYPKLPKSERDNIKDFGGFVAGHLRDNRRQKDKVQCRSMLVYDLDDIPQGFLENINAYIPNCSCWYTTHSHTPEHPRARLIIPTARDMTPDEFNAIARYYAADNGFIEVLDPCCFLPHQLMYWPSCSSNGEYLFGVTDGDWLDPDDVLSRHPEWRDCSLLPTTPQESRVLERTMKKQKDPCDKEGIVGAVSRTYTVQDIIDTYLSDVYAPSANSTDQAGQPNRYDYIAGEGSSGLVVYDGKFAYSHHATDPAGGKLCNAFDLVRIHKFGDLGEKESFDKMCELAMEDDSVKLEIAREREEQAKKEFQPIDTGNKESPASADGSASPGSLASSGIPPSLGKSQDWRALLKYMKRSTVLENSVWNEMLILNNDPDFANFAYNEFVNQVEVTGEVPWKRPPDNKYWRDADTAQLKALLDVRYVPFSNRNHDIAFAKVADDRSFHPIRDYLDSLPPWDGVHRVETLLIDCLEAEDTPYVRTVTRKTFAAAVARIYHPGIKFDSVLVLDGYQGIGKSSFFKELVGEEYFSDTLSLTDLSDKSGAEKLQGCWVMEIAELAGMKKADVERVKAFLSTSDDKYRPSYGHTVESHPRQGIIVASVNGERGYLRDITGNRRFWVVKVSKEGQKKDWNLDRDQIWAEAKAIWENGEKLYLEGDIAEQADKAQREAMEVDERKGLVEEYLDKLLPEEWDFMDLNQRQLFLGGSPAVDYKGVKRREAVSNVEIWTECLNRNAADMKPADSYAIAALMTQIPGWERSNKTSKLSIYGRQRLYLRVED